MSHRAARKGEEDQDLANAGPASEVFLKIYRCGARDQNLRDPEDTQTAERDQLEPGGVGQAQVEAICTDHSQEHGQEVCGGLRLPLCSALWVGPLGITFAEWGGVALRRLLPRMAATMSTALQRRRESRQRARVEDGFSRGGPRRHKLVGYQIVILLAPVPHGVGVHELAHGLPQNLAGAATLKRQSKWCQERKEAEAA